MAKINLLDSSIYNLIAAGEVVERPASVIKELVENSIDAGAKNITIEIKDGGISFMQVVDDGSGIEEDDLKSAFLPHATSKIKNASDLETIFTLGFRGEALASISSVAKVTLTSKTEKQDIGNSITVEGGKFGEVKKVSHSKGTVMTVKDLFYCVPARAKFLKKPKQEEQEITNIVIRTILAHPDINFTFIVDGKKKMTSLGATEKEALYSVYGKEAVNEVLEIKAERNNVKVRGFVGKPTYSKSNRTYQTLIINGRYVVNLTVQTAVSNAYGDFLMKRQYPFFVIYIDMPADEVDVNVHPNKLDVKFLKSNEIYSIVFEAVSRALNGMDYVKEIDSNYNTSFTFSKNVAPKAEIDKAGVNLNPFSTDFSSLNQEEKDNMKDTIFDSMIKTNEDGEEKLKDNFGLGSKLLERINENITNTQTGIYGENVNKEKDVVETSEVLQNNFLQSKLDEYKQNILEQVDFAKDEFKIIGKIFNTYLIIEWGENMYLIDQHAAHERLMYDKFKAEYETGDMVIQPMLIPFVISLNPEDDMIINENLEAIKSVGFDIDDFGDRTYKISAVPSIVSGIDFNKFFAMFLAEKLGKNKITEAELVKDNLMQMACKSAVKGGDDLTKIEVEKLLMQMSKKDTILFCPHGRPVVVRITKVEIEKWFKRIV
ncbi:MAG: DNA mismatch repair endonuclease MutL [Clostridia bacterium]|nr:DNA mismatch repair endonuclease MutL [Clostridia bacterium]